MNMESWALIIATLVGVVLTWIGTLVSSHFTNVKGGADAAHSEVQALASEFLKFQIQVANEYAKISEVNRLEEGIIAVLTRLETKFDNLQKILYSKGTP